MSGDRDDEYYERLAEEALAQDAIFQRPHEDVIAWVMRTKGLSFPDAVHYVANELLEGEGQ